MLRVMALSVSMMCLPSITLANEPEYPLIHFKKPCDSVVIFEKCFMKNACEVIGNSSGYSVNDLNFSPGFLKLKAIGVGTVEVAAGVFTGGVAGMAAWGAGASGVLMWGTTYATGAAVGFAPTFIDKLNPFVQWQMSNVETQIGKTMTADKNAMFVEFQDVIHMEKFSNSLAKVLETIKSPRPICDQVVEHSPVIDNSARGKVKEKNVEDKVGDQKTGSAVYK